MITTNYKLQRDHNKLQAAAMHLISATEQETLMTDISDDLMGRLQGAIDACNDAGEKKNKSPLAALRRKVRDGDKVLKVPDSSSFASSSRSASLSPSPSPSPSPSLSTSHSRDSISDFTDISDEEAGIDSSQDVPARKAPQPPLQAPPILVTPAMRSNSEIEQHEVLKQLGRGAQKAEKHSDQTKELWAVKAKHAARREKAEALNRELEREQASRKNAEARIAGLEAELAAGKQTAEAQIAGLEAELAAGKQNAEAQIAGLEAELAAGKQNAEARIAGLEAELAEGKQNAEARIAGLEAELAEGKQNAEARIAGLEAELAAGKQNAEARIAGLGAELAAGKQNAEARIAGLEAELAAIQEKAGAQIAGLEAELAAGKENAEARIAGLEAELAAGREKAEARIADLEGELATFHEKAKAGTKRGWPLIIAGTVGILAAAALVTVGILLPPVGLTLLAAGAVATGILATSGTTLLGFGIRSKIKNAKAKQGYMPIPSETETVSRRGRTSSRDTTQRVMVLDDGASYTPLHSGSFSTRSSLNAGGKKDSELVINDANSPSKR